MDTRSNAEDDIIKRINTLLNEPEILASVKEQRRAHIANQNKKIRKQFLQFLMERQINKTKLSSTKDETESSKIQKKIEKINKKINAHFVQLQKYETELLNIKNNFQKNINDQSSNLENTTNNMLQSLGTKSHPDDQAVQDELNQLEKEVDLEKSLETSQKNDGKEEESSANDNYVAPEKNKESQQEDNEISAEFENILGSDFTKEEKDEFLAEMNEYTSRSNNSDINVSTTENEEESDLDEENDVSEEEAEQSLTRRSNSKTVSTPPQPSTPERKADSHQTKTEANIPEVQIPTNQSAGNVNVENAASKKTDEPVRNEGKEEIDVNDNSIIGSKDFIKNVNERLPSNKQSLLSNKFEIVDGYIKNYQLRVSSEYLNKEEKEKFNQTARSFKKEYDLLFNDYNNLKEPSETKIQKLTKAIENLRKGLTKSGNEVNKLIDAYEKQKKNLDGLIVKLNDIIKFRNNSLEPLESRLKDTITSIETAEKNKLITEQQNKQLTEIAATIDKLIQTEKESIIALKHIYDNIKNIAVTPDNFNKVVTDLNNEVQKVKPKLNIEESLQNLNDTFEIFKNANIDHNNKNNLFITKIKNDIDHNLLRIDAYKENLKFFKSTLIDQQNKLTPQQFDNLNEYIHSSEKAVIKIKNKLEQLQENMETLDLPVDNEKKSAEILNLLNSKQSSAGNILSELEKDLLDFPNMVKKFSHLNSRGDELNEFLSKQQDKTEEKSEQLFNWFEKIDELPNRTDVNKEKQILQNLARDLNKNALPLAKYIHTNLDKINNTKKFLKDLADDDTEKTNDQLFTIKQKNIAAIKVIDKAIQVHETIFKNVKQLLDFNDRLKMYKNSPQLTQQQQQELTKKIAETQNKINETESLLDFQEKLAKIDLNSETALQQLENLSIQDKDLNVITLDSVNKKIEEINSEVDEITDLHRKFADAKTKILALKTLVQNTQRNLHQEFSILDQNHLERKLQAAKDRDEISDNQLETLLTQVKPILTSIEKEQTAINALDSELDDITKSIDNPNQIDDALTRLDELVQEHGNSQRHQHEIQKIRANTQAILGTDALLNADKASYAKVKELGTFANQQNQRPDNIQKIAKDYEKDIRDSNDLTSEQKSILLDQIKSLNKKLKPTALSELNKMNKDLDKASHLSALPNVDNVNQATHIANNVLKNKDSIKQKTDILEHTFTDINDRFEAFKYLKTIKDKFDDLKDAFKEFGIEREFTALEHQFKTLSKEASHLKHDDTGISLASFNSKCKAVYEDAIKELTKKFQSLLEENKKQLNNAKNKLNNLYTNTIQTTLNNNVITQQQHDQITDNILIPIANAINQEVDEINDTHDYLQTLDDATMDELLPQNQNDLSAKDMIVGLKKEREETLKQINTKIEALDVEERLAKATEINNQIIKLNQNLGILNTKITNPSLDVNNLSNTQQNVFNPKIQSLRNEYTQIQDAIQDPNIGLQTRLQQVQLDSPTALNDLEKLIEDQPLQVTTNSISKRLDDANKSADQLTGLYNKFKEAHQKLQQLNTFVTNSTQNLNQESVKISNHINNHIDAALNNKQISREQSQTLSTLFRPVKEKIKAEGNNLKLLNNEITIIEKTINKPETIDQEIQKLNKLTNQHIDSTFHDKQFTDIQNHSNHIINQCNELLKAYKEVNTPLLILESELDVHKQNIDKLKKDIVKTTESIKKSDNDNKIKPDQKNILDKQIADLNNRLINLPKFKKFESDFNQSKEWASSLNINRVRKASEIAETASRNNDAVKAEYLALEKTNQDIEARLTAFEHLNPYHNKYQPLKPIFTDFGKQTDFDALEKKFKDLSQLASSLDNAHLNEFKNQCDGEYQDSILNSVKKLKSSIDVKYTEIENSIRACLDANSSMYLDPQIQSNYKVLGNITALLDQLGELKQTAQLIDVDNHDLEKIVTKFTETKNNFDQLYSETFKKFTNLEFSKNSETLRKADLIMKAALLGPKHFNGDKFQDKIDNNTKVIDEAIQNCIKHLVIEPNDQKVKDKLEKLKEIKESLTLLNQGYTAKTTVRTELVSIKDGEDYEKALQNAMKKAEIDKTPLATLVNPISDSGAFDSTKFVKNDLKPDGSNFNYHESPLLYREDIGQKPPSTVVDAVMNAVQSAPKPSLDGKKPKAQPYSPENRNTWVDHYDQADSKKKLTELVSVPDRLNPKIFLLDAAEDYLLNKKFDLDKNVGGQKTVKSYHTDYLGRASNFTGPKGPEFKFWQKGMTDQQIEAHKQRFANQITETLVFNLKKLGTTVDKKSISELLMQDLNFVNAFHTEASAKRYANVMGEVFARTYRERLNQTKRHPFKEELPSNDIIVLAIQMIEGRRKSFGEGPIVIEPGVYCRELAQAFMLYCKSQNYEVVNRSGYDLQEHEYQNLGLFRTLDAFKKHITTDVAVKPIYEEQSMGSHAAKQIAKMKPDQQQDVNGPRKYNGLVSHN